MIRNNVNKITASLIICSLLLSSCGRPATDIETSHAEGENSGSSIQLNDTQSSDSSETAPTAEYSEFDLNTEAGSETVHITLNGDSAQFESDNVSINDGTIVISAAGDYEFTGSYNGQICVKASDEDNVHIILNGVTLSAVMAPLNFVNAKNVSITLAEGSVNSVTDSADYTFADGEDEPNAAIFSKCDLTINGTGELTVLGQYECGIRSKDDLIIVNGNITVNSVGDAIKGKDSLVIRDGNFTVQTNGDGLKSNNDEDADRGYVIIEGGTFDISAADDGIHAETWLQIFGGDITINESYEALESRKIEIYGGNLDLKASDDGLNASSGSSTETDDLSQFDKGDKQFDFSDTFGGFFGGDQSGEMPDGMPTPEEGFTPEMPEDGTIPEFPQDGTMPEMPNGMVEDPMNGMRPDGGRGGQFGDQFGGQGGFTPETLPSDETKDAEIVSTSFTFTSAKASPQNGTDTMRGGGNRGDMGGMFGGMGGGMGNETPEEGVYIKIEGGTIRVQAGVDVIDSNGTFEQNGGTLITVGTSMTVCGQPDGVIDTNGDAYVNGGTFISLARNSGSVDSFTNLPSFTLSTSGANASENFTILDSNGNTVFEFVPETSSSVIFLTSDLLTVGEEYTVRYGSTESTFTATEAITTVK